MAYSGFQEMFNGSHLAELNKLYTDELCLTVLRMIWFNSIIANEEELTKNNEDFEVDEEVDESKTEQILNVVRARFTFDSLNGCDELAKSIWGTYYLAGCSMNIKDELRTIMFADTTKLSVVITKDDITKAFIAYKNDEGIKENLSLRGFCKHLFSMFNKSAPALYNEIFNNEEKKPKGNMWIKARNAARKAKLELKESDIYWMSDAIPEDAIPEELLPITQLLIKSKSEEGKTNK